MEGGIFAGETIRIRVFAEKVGAGSMGDVCIVCVLISVFKSIRFCVGLVNADLIFFNLKNKFRRINSEKINVYR